MLLVIRRVGMSIQTMPRAKAMRWAERLGALAYVVARRNRRYGTRNLRLVQFPRPDSTEAERSDLIRRVFITFAKTMVELFRSPVTSAAEIEALVETEGWENLTGAYARGKGVICLSAHFGNWEIFARYVHEHGMPVTVIAREPEDPEFAAYLRSIRAAQGYTIKTKGSAARDVLAVLKRGEVMGILPDQNSGDLFVPFFGVPAGTVAGPATFALHTDCSIVPCFGIRLPDDRYRLLFLPPLTVNSTGDRNEDVRRVMTEVNRVLESVVRDYPDQWLWVHNRWKASFEAHNLPRAWPEGPDSAEYRAALRRWESE